ncbi:hypothetical protein HMPREF1552_02484 [Leptotrichia sp. oral taxon 879 str. F0557]|nr:hypothetical protein HMPREF1552_02484 [Leptotrichia sp. oral taxon 879 str. F0557]
MTIIKNKFNLNKSTLLYNFYNILAIQFPKIKTDSSFLKQASSYIQFIFYKKLFY